MGYTAITDSEIQVKKPITQSLMQKIKNNLDWHETQLSQLNSAQIPNFSFETNTDNNNIPDQWTRNLYQGGSGGFTTGVHGAKAYYLTHPGGAGNGGGELISDYINISPNEVYVVSFLMWASSGNGAIAKVKINYYNSSKAYLSTEEVFSMTPTNTSAVLFLTSSFIPPAGARFLKVVLIGGDPAGTSAGTIYFDRVMLDNINLWQKTVQKQINAVSTQSTTYVDVASFNLTNIPYGVTIKLIAELYNSGGDTTYMRFRIGGVYSNEVTTTSAEYVPGIFTLTPTVAVVGPQITVYMQLKVSRYNGYGRKISDLSVYIYPS